MSDFFDRLERELCAAVPRQATASGVPVRGLRRDSVRLSRHLGSALAVASTLGVLAFAGFALMLLHGAGTSRRSGSTGLVYRVGPPIPAAPQPYAQVEPGAPPHVGPSPAEAAALLRRIGRPIRASARAFVLEPDPAGGPPWGVLVYRTSTGLYCEHGGRVVAGRVGIIDAGAVLHPYLPDLSGCDIGMRATEVVTQGGVLAWGGLPRCAIGGGSRRVRACPPDSLRTFMEGIFPTKNLKPNGPRPVLLTVSAPGGRLVERLPHGAFVYVFRGSLNCSTWPRMTVTYSDGSTGPGWPPIKCPRRQHRARRP